MLKGHFSANSRSSPSDSHLLKSPKMTFTEFNSTERFTMKHDLKDGVPRVPMPKFRIGDAVTRRSDEGTGRNSISTFISKFLRRTEQDTHIYSVEEHVNGLVRFLHRRDAEKNILDPTWDKFMSAYQRDVSQRILAVIIQEAAVGEYRQKLIDKTLTAIEEVLRTYVYSPGRKDFCCGWVFFILEKSLCEALQRGYQSLPDEAETCDREEVEPLMDTASQGLVYAKDFAIQAIERIESGRQADQRGVIFDFTRNQLKFPEKCIKDPDGSEKDGLDPDILHRFHQSEASSHNVVIEMKEKEWELTSKHVAASYVRWCLKDSATGRVFLGFLPSKTTARLRTIGCISVGLTIASVIILALAS